MKLLRDPLLHFLILGAVLFGVYALVTGVFSSKEERRIEIGEAEIEFLTGTFERQWGREPTSKELTALIEARDRGRPFDLVLSHWGADQTLELRGEPLANGPRLLATMRGEDLRAPVILFSAPTDFAERKREALGLGARAYCHRYEALFREIEAVFTEEP